ncbi:S8 family serine peptidase [Phaeocystidibacter luteus]|uniref:S8 family serine peptidase n=1 Tax=Phaeocystidibacter luteus TaxID=911197 RepID=A0A6N6RM73_9FLAO|nr:S8 family serine peptidase [Phaeocystidibacter luteus]KAB2814656.1 S8 family serine peptidase [Phaeocystidibacter luteus]
MKKLYTYSLLALGLAAQPAFGQNEPRLLLNSGTYSLNPQQSSVSLSATQEESMTMLRIVQFSRPLIQEEREWLENNVGEIINYLPINAYSMLLPNGTELNDFGSLPLHAVEKFSAEMKISDRLRELNVPDYVWRGDRQIEVVAGLVKYSNTSAIAQRMSSEGVSVVSYDPENNTITLIIDIDDRLTIAADPSVAFLHEGEDPGSPENFNATRSARSRAVNTRYSGGRAYDGSGVVVGLGDDGDIGPHVDYSGRIIARNTNASSGDHGDHVAGTIFGAGNIDPLAAGMAPGADMFYYRYPRNLNNVDADYASHAVRITNSSYSNGCNAGYTAFTQQMDEDIIQNPKLMHVFSAGNSGSSNCGYGAGAGWGNVTGGHKIGKNVIATANITSTDAIAPSSSRGPSADGRLKPDIASVGTSVYSTTDPDDYTFKTGTSMSAPGIAGGMAQMFEAFVSSHGSEPDGGLQKAFLMNSADDLGNPGPDFIYGYGRMNLLRSIRDIETGNFFTDSVTTGQADSFQINVPANTAEVRVMLYWTDPAATPAAARALVNDLDATLRAPGSTVYQPWVLDPTPNATLLNENAVRATDTMNNAEQVTVASPSAGSYWFVVNGTNVPLGPQKYYVVYSFVPDAVELTYPFGGEAIDASNPTTIYWDASVGSTSFTLEYSTDNGTSWSTIGTAGANARQLDWNNLPNVATNDLLVRITRGTQTDMVDSPVTLIDVPNRLGLVQACPDSFIVSWNPVAGAAEYEVYALGQKYMDSINRTTDTFQIFTGIPPTQEVWWSVAAVPTAGQPAGQRAIARKKESGLQGCLVNTDVAIEFVSPQSGVIGDCHNLNTIQATVAISNPGLTAIDSIPLAISFNGGTAMWDTVYTQIPSGGTINHTFTTTYNTSSIGSYTFEAWNFIADDGNRYNDSAFVSYDVNNGGTTKSAPYTQNFDAWTSCATTTNCEAGVCNLFDDWNNLTNGGFDDIDFRTNNGSTPSSGTGPSFDNTQGNNTGKYLYLEASGGCSFKWAYLVSPCIDLSTITLPELEFFYHMNGGDIGELHVDIFSNGVWHLDVVTPIIGNQGNQWIGENLSLVPWQGQIVSVRFRASTAGDYQGDLAIDDFSITQAAGAPVAAFSVSNPTPCSGEVVQITDQSTNVPAGWAWTITPGTHSFVNGTSATSQNPEVVFSALGNYDIKLVASNVNGADSVIAQSAVIVGNGLPLPYVEDFQGPFLPAGWQLENPDGLTTWEGQSCIGYDGNATMAVRVNNFVYGSNGQQDRIISPSIDLGTVTSPALVYDLSYIGTTTNKNDRLQIQISSDCGNTWDAPVFDATGTALTTFNFNTNTEFIPTGSGFWKRDTIDLSSYVGNSVKIRFINITDGGNALYLDNIQLYDLSVTPPSSAFTANLVDSCLARTYSFSYNTTAGTSVSWDFGSGATPATAVGAGPHNVTYSFGGSKLVEMTATNAGGTVSSNVVWPINQKPTADYTYAFVTNTNGLDVQFSSNISSGQIDTYYWDFGDGDTSSAANPLHSYTVGGSYNIMLITENDCGPDTVVKNIPNVSVIENTPTDWILAPNPANNQIALYATNGDLGVDHASIYDISGKELISESIRVNESEILFDISTLPAGVYLLRAQTENQMHSMRFVVQR